MDITFNDYLCQEGQKRTNYILLQIGTTYDGMV